MSSSNLVKMVIGAVAGLLVGCSAVWIIHNLRKGEPVLLWTILFVVGLITCIVMAIFEKRNQK